MISRIGSKSSLAGIGRQIRFNTGIYISAIGSLSNIVRCIGSSPIDYTREVKYRKGGPILRPLPKIKESYYD